MAAGYAHHVLYITALQIARTLNCRGRVRIVLGKHPVISLYPTIKYIIQSLGVYYWGSNLNCWPSSDHILLRRSNEVKTFLPPLSLHRDRYRDLWYPLLLLCGQ